MLSDIRNYLTSSKHRQYARYYSASMFELHSFNFQVLVSITLGTMTKFGPFKQLEKKVIPIFPPQISHECAIQQKITLTSCFSYIYLLWTGITCVLHHTQFMRCSRFIQVFIHVRQALYQLGHISFGLWFQFVNWFHCLWAYCEAINHGRPAQWNKAAYLMVIRKQKGEKPGISYTTSASSVIEFLHPSLPPDPSITNSSMD